MRTGIFGVGFAALLLAMLATGCDPRNDSSLPPVGSYRISNLNSMRREDPLTRAIGKVAIFQVDYQGPREWAEVVVEHWRGSERLGTDVIMRMKFGSRVVERHDWGESWGNGPAFSHLRQRYSVWLRQLGRPLPANVNTFAEVKVVNPAEPDSVSLHTSQIDLPAHREDAGPIEEAWIFSGHRDAELHVDSESTLLWRKSAEMTGHSMTGDSATGSPSAPRIESVVYFRLVPN